MGSPSKSSKKARSRLGRGLSALVDQHDAVAVEAGAQPRPKRNANDLEMGVDAVVGTASTASEQYHKIEVLRVVPNPNQPRRVFDPEALNELSESIAEHGLMQPIVVRRLPVDGDGGGACYELIAGERRWRATRQAGLDSIPAIVLDVDEAESAQLALIENIQREDLNPVDRARGFELLIDRYAMTQEQVSKRVGISRSSVANFLRLLELDEEIQSLIASGVISTGHGKALLSCKDESRRVGLAMQAASQGWSVRVLERAAGRAAAPEAEDAWGDSPTRRDAAEPTRLESVLRDLENRLGEHLGTRVKLKTSGAGTKGKIEIEFYDLDQFDGLLSRLGVVSDDGAGVSA